MSDLHNNIENFIIKLFSNEKLYNNINENYSFYKVSDFIKDNFNEIIEKYNISENEFKEIFINLLVSKDLTKQISEDIDVVKLVVDNLFSNEDSIDETDLNKIAFNILQSFKSYDLDINQLYQPITFSNSLKEKKEFIEQNIYRYISFNKKHEGKEAIGVINTFLETSEYNKSDIDLLWNKSKPNKEKFTLEEHSKRFIRSLLIEINDTSITGAPFSLVNNKDNFKIIYKAKNNGLYDHFMYSNKSKRFGLNFSTLSTDTDIDSMSIYKHSLSFLTTIYYMENWFKEEFNNLDSLSNKDRMKEIRIIFNATCTGFHGAEHFKKAFLKNEYENMVKNNTNLLAVDDKTIESAIRGINKNLNFYFKPLIVEFNESNQDNPIKYDIINEYDEKDLNENYNSLSHTYLFHIKKGDLKRLTSMIKSKFSIFYFGEVNSTKSKDLIYDKNNNFTNEEMRAGLNILAYAGNFTEGFDGFNIESEEMLRFITETINHRFNSSTEQKFGCIDNIKLNNSLNEIGKIYIENYMINTEHINKKFNLDNNSVLKNMANFEVNLLTQIKQKYMDTKCHPQQAFNNILRKFNIEKDIKLTTFLENISIRNQFHKDVFINVEHLIFGILESTKKSNEIADLQEQIKKLQEENMKNNRKKY